MEWGSVWHRNILGACMVLIQKILELGLGRGVTSYERRRGGKLAAIDTDDD